MKNIKRTVVYLDGDVRRALSRRASRVRQSISHVVNEVVRELLGDDPGRPNPCREGPEKRNISRVDNGNDNFEADRHLVEGILLLLYASRRQDLGGGGLGVMHIEQEFGCPAAHLEFHLWYLREKGWIQRLESGLFAITVAGVDKVIERDNTPRQDRPVPKTIAASNGSNGLNGNSKVRGLLQPV